jgi:predicted AlkP superfamily phosphohydrolase/phosphomutase
MASVVTTNNQKKILVVGLDCAAPELVFDKYRSELPVINSLMNGGWFAPLRSCSPPITVPAWMCMASGLDPGQLGVYGFRTRRRGSVKESVVDAREVSDAAIWHRLDAEGLACVVLNVPLTFPPERLRHGIIVADFLGPNDGCARTEPKDIADQIRHWVGEYPVDIAAGRRHDRRVLVDDARAMCDAHFEVARRLLTERDWNFAMVVEVGLDRLHHELWACIDPAHPRFEPDSPWAEELRNYYVLLDYWIGRLLECCDVHTSVFVVSDHGAQAMQGGFRINEWLRSQGLLVLHNEPQRAMRFDPGEVDWERTSVFAWGGYHARIHLNIKGREPFGRVAPEEAPKLIEQIAEQLRKITGPNGEAWQTSVQLPESLYHEVRGLPPDLLAFFDQLRWRALDTVGGDSELHWPECDHGPSGANHAWQGILIHRDMGSPNHGHPELEEQDLLDLVPTWLAMMGRPLTPRLRGHPIAKFL